MDKRLAVYLFGHNLNKICYPWHAAIRSALALAGAGGRVYFCECESSDDTFDDAIGTFAPQVDAGLLTILKHPWGSHFSIQARIANYLLDAISEDGYEWTLKLDADEVLCEWSFDRFREDLEGMTRRGFLLGRPHYTHFCPDADNEFDFIYRSKAVISRQRPVRIRFNTDPSTGNADACALGGWSEWQTGLEIYHYGKMQVGRRTEALWKEYSFQQLYVDLGFPDPKVVEQLPEGKIDYDRIFQTARERGEFREFHGRHPVFVQGWLNEQYKKEGRDA